MYGLFNYAIITVLGYRITLPSANLVHRRLPTFFVVNVTQIDEWNVICRIYRQF
jgi:hypothetical protein